MTRSGVRSTGAAGAAQGKQAQSCEHTGRVGQLRSRASKLSACPKILAPEIPRMRVPSTRRASVGRRPLMWARRPAAGPAAALACCRALAVYCAAACGGLGHR